MLSSEALTIKADFHGKKCVEEGDEVGHYSKHQVPSQAGSDPMMDG